MPAQARSAIAPTLRSDGPGFLVVGIGASAGGLAAFEAFFAGLPANPAPGMAFVLVQHLAPAHSSLLPEILRRFTSLPVDEVTDGMAIAADHVYVIPPGWDLAVHGGRMQLLNPVAPAGHRLPIDGFFRSLALDYEDAAVGIVLSGTGSDGSQGLQAIKRAGGLVLVQSLETAEFDGMPRAAVDTRMADEVLAPGEMPARLTAHAERSFRMTVAPGEPPPGAALALNRIYARLRARTGHDFTHYKPTTVQRRIQRRMAVHRIDGIEGYATYLQQSDGEVQALFEDLLIGVTQFFRDAEAFQALQAAVLPALAARHAAGETLRLWVPGCSSGEEAYTLAVLLLEHLGDDVRPPRVQVFATDIDRRAIAAARIGLYPPGIAADIGPERLMRHFAAEADGRGYRVRKHLRDLIVFSEHDLTRDPPFSKLDLISCRNLLIYLDATLQKRIIPLFRYALKPGGILFLGSSESIGEFDRLFETVDRRAKLFRRLSDSSDRPRSPLNQMLPPTAADGVRPDAIGSLPMSLPKPSLRERIERAILRELPIVAALVDAQGDVFYLHGRTGLYLEPMPGEAGTSNLLEMAREGLRRELALALAQAAALQKRVDVAGVRVRTNGHHTPVDVVVSPLDAVPDPAGSTLYLVMLQVSAGGGSAPAVAEPPPAGEPATDARVVGLTEALRLSEQRVQALHEELESSIEELRSSTEEMQSVNEELQSANEELETSKEELQSVNEELSTVNTELEHKVLDLSRANDDMNNLLAGTGIATVFVDHDLRILRFTPGAGAILNVIASDIGRPVGHLASNLDGYDGLVADTQSVLDTLVSKTHDVRTRDGRWYAMRVQPYRTVQNVIEGAVITFVDISESVRMRLALRKVNEVLRLAVVVRDAFDAVTVHDLEGRTLAWNPAAAALYGWSEEEALVLNYRDRVPSELRAEALAALRQSALSDVSVPALTQRLAKDGRTVEVWVKATPLQNDEGQLYAVATTERVPPL